MTRSEVQTETLTIVKFIDSICSKLGLKYFVMYGTLIGAVRHHGFIPWDDDFDIVMFRDDYERFLNYMSSNETGDFYVDNPETNKCYPFYISRVCNRKYTLLFDNLHYRSGLFVDIYPFDGLGDKKDQSWWTKEKNQRIYWLERGLLFSRTKSLLWGNSLLHKLGNLPLMLFSKMVGNMYFFNKLETYKTRFSLDNSKFVSDPCWTSRLIFYEKEWFASPIMVKFENLEVPIPNGYDIILRLIYGDYMTLPPESERVSTHGYTAYKTEDYCKNNAKGIMPQ